MTHINDEHVETADNLDIVIVLYSLIEYSDNCSDSSGSLWKYKRDKQNINAAGNIDLLKGLTTRDIGANINPDIANTHRLFVNAQIVVLLKYLLKFLRSLEMPLINCKIHLGLNWTKNSIMSNVATATTFQLTSTKLYVPVVTLPIKESTKLTKQFWNEYNNKMETQQLDNNNLKRIPLHFSFQGVNRLFVLALDNTNNGTNRVQRDSHRKYFLPRVSITKYNVLIDGRNFYDQPISDQIRKYDEIRKIATGKGNDYTTGCLLDYKYVRDNYQLICCNLIQQKELDADPRAIQQLEFN